MMNSGIFITVEGVDCSGKTSNIKAIADMLNVMKIPFTQTREPGGTPFAEELRSFIFQSTADHKDLPYFSEALLFYSARIDHCVNLINPELEKDGLVISDRFYDSTFAYQGAQNADDPHVMQRLELLHRTCMETGLIQVPTKTLLYDIPVDTYIDRKLARGTVAGEEKNGLEDRDVEYFKTVRSILLERANAEPNRFIVIDANRPLEKVVRYSKEIVSDILNETL